MKVVYFRIIAYLCLTFTKQFMKRIIVSILLVSMCVMGPAAFAQANKLPVAQQGEVSIVNNTIWQPKHRHTLWYTEPAKVWMTSALPLGNGQLGACFMGGVKCDEVQFNEKTLWRGHVGSVTDHSAYGSYLDFGHLYITDTDPRLTEVSDYRRWLDIDDACAGVAYSAQDISYHREYFVSYPDNVLAVRYRATKGGMLNKRITLLNVNGEAPRYTRTSRHSGTAFFAGEVKRTGTEKDERYCCALRVVAKGGRVGVSDGGSLEVRGADELVVYLSAATNFSPDNDDYVDGDHQTIADRVWKWVESAAAKGYERVREDHLADYHRLYNRCQLSITTQENEVPTPVLINRFRQNPRQNLLLEQLYFSYARYLMIASSRGVDLPSNLQGIWNDSNTPAWNSDIHSNINVQMNYWLAETTNLSELHLPFLNYIHREACLRSQWQRNAREIGGVGRGWTLTTENNIYGSGSNWMQNYTIANAWYCLHLWQHYQYTLDTDYLWHTALPAMKSCCEYWMDRLVLAADGTYECPDEYSPEHGPKAENATAHAQQLVWSLFHNTLKGYEEYERRTGSRRSASTATFLGELREKFLRLDTGLATETVHGEQLLREWKYTSQQDVKTYNSHRHLSHLIALYPGSQLSSDTNPGLFQAAVNSLNRRGYEGTGWSMGWKINCHARAGDGERCGQLLEKALQLQTNTGFSEDGGIYENLWDAHTPFQIDGNFGAAAGMAEMLLQSHTGKLHLLPALPSAWTTGTVKGLRGVGNFTVDISWSANRLESATILSVSGEHAVIRYSDISRSYTVKDEAGNILSTTQTAPDEISFPTRPGGRYRIEKL